MVGNILNKVVLIGLGYFFCLCLGIIFIEVE